MSVSAISAAASFQPSSSHQTAASGGQHLRGGQRTPSLTDIDAQGSSVASAPSTTGKIGSKINISA